MFDIKYSFNDVSFFHDAVRASVPLLTASCSTVTIYVSVNLINK